jgi:hypothetical protein
MSTTPPKEPALLRCPHCRGIHRGPEQDCPSCTLAFNHALGPGNPDTAHAYRSARCQYCDAVAPVFGPSGNLPVSPLPRQGWGACEDGDRIVWTCPDCRRFADLLCEPTAAPPGTATGERTRAPVMNSTPRRPPPVRRCPRCGAKHRLTNWSGYCAGCEIAYKIAHNLTLRPEEERACGLAAPPVPDGSSLLALRSARCQFCGRVEPLFGPLGNLPVSPLPAAGWDSREQGDRVVWTCPRCCQFADLLCDPTA